MDTHCIQYDIKQMNKVKIFNCAILVIFQINVQLTICALVHVEYDLELGKLWDLSHIKGRDMY